MFYYIFFSVIFFDQLIKGAFACSIAYAKILIYQSLLRTKKCHLNIILIYYYLIARKYSTCGVYRVVTYLLLFCFCLKCYLHNKDETSSWGTTRIKLTIRYLWWMVPSHYKNRHGINAHLTNYYIMDNRETLSYDLISWMVDYPADCYLGWLIGYSMLLVKFGSDFYSICTLDQIHSLANISLHDYNVTL